MQKIRPTRRHRRATITSLGAVLLTAGLLSVPTAFADHPEVSLPGSNFEIDTDANLIVDDAPSEDWAIVDEIRKQDSPTGKGDESFGQGTKEDTAAPVVVKGSIPPNKSDLKFFGVYQEGTSSAGFLNLYWSRVQEPVGTTNMDFEFNHRQCTKGATPADPDCTANGITPKRSLGDLLITYDLSQGGTNPQLSIREWTVDGAWGPALDLSASNKATGSINTSAIPAGESDGLGAHSERTFGEAQIDLSAVFDSDTCETFGSAYLKSRASDSFTAALKDFVPPADVDITNCGSVKINKKDDSGNVLGGAGFTLYNDAGTIGGTREAGTIDTITSPVLSCETAATGTCTIPNVPFGDYWVVETKVPAGYEKAPDEAISVPNASVVVVNLVDPRIVLTPTITTAQSFVPNDSATVSVASGNGALAGNVRFRLFDNAGCLDDAAAGGELYDSGNISVASGTGTGVTRTVSSSNTTAYTEDMTFSWLVTFTSTNNGHRSVTSVCDDEHSELSINNNNILP